MNIKQKIQKLQGQREIFGFFNRVQELDKTIDKYFGIESKEKFVKDKEENLYAGIEMSALSTSYLDYYQILFDLDEGHTLVDIGAGYCRGSFLANELNKNCISIEIDKNRSMLAKNKFSNKVIQSDIKEVALPNADAYFIYLPWGELSNQIIKFLLKRNEKCCLYVIESHGDFIDNLSLYSEFMLLDDIIKVSNKRHKNRIYKYEFCPSDKFININEDSYKKIELLPYWLIKYSDEINEFKINTRNIDNSFREWSVKSKNSYACYYDKEVSIYIPYCSRYLQYHFDTIISYS